VSDLEELDAGWSRSPPARAVREGVLMGVLSPLMDLYTRRTVRGREHVEGLEPPVLFVANHSSHMDTPVILRALPSRWRRRTAVAAAADYFYDKRRKAVSASLAFGTVPIDRTSRGGVGPAQTAHLDRLIGDGGSLLVFAEGTRSRDGRVGRLRSGAALLAAEHQLPIVPIYVSGTREAMPRGHHWMVFKAGRPGPRHALEIRFGNPIVPRTDDRPSEVMERVRLFLAESGARTERELETEPAHRRQPA
jgi:1-acyl-sn-glycerol-3-phosphate acyltransferase